MLLQFLAICAVIAPHDIQQDGLSHQGLRQLCLLCFFSPIEGWESSPSNSIRNFSMVAPFLTHSAATTATAWSLSCRPLFILCSTRQVMPTYIAAGTRLLRAMDRSHTSADTSSGLADMICTSTHGVEASSQLLLVCGCVCHQVSPDRLQQMAASTFLCAVNLHVIAKACLIVALDCRI